jgi:hypothetical protein
MSRTRNKFSPEICDRAVRMVGEHRADYGSEWEAMSSLGADEKVRIRALEREVKELRRANEILRKASAYFAMAEFDRHERLSVVRTFGTTHGVNWRSAGLVRGLC